MNTNPRNVRKQGHKSLIAAVRSVFLLVVLLQVSQAQWYVNNSNYNEAPFKVGEQLQFKVKWGFVRLGSVFMYQERVSQQDPQLYRLVARARSAAGLPFVNVDLINRATLSSHNPRNCDFRFIDNSSARSGADFSYDSCTSIETMTGIDDGKDTTTTKIYCEEQCFDALGFMMFVRALSGSGYRLTVPLIMQNCLKKTQIIFHKEIEKITIGLSDEPVLAHRFETTGDWSDSHSAGMNGKMTGWTSADSAAVPLLVEMKIAVGSVRVELESFTREGWVPPVASRSTDTIAIVRRGEK
ncbi:MAG TPA: DUF3108 domain-containing protein [Candidatus Kryptonia bacterium]